MLGQSGKAKAGPKARERAGATMLAIGVILIFVLLMGALNYIEFGRLD